MELAAFLNRQGFSILAAAANQGAAFRFPVGGRWKAPDVVAYRDDLLLVAEAKLRAADLFRVGDGHSDFQAMKAVGRSAVVQRRLVDEAARRLRVQEIDVNLRTVVPMVASGSPLGAYSAMCEAARVAAIQCVGSGSPRLIWGEAPFTRLPWATS